MNRIGRWILVALGMAFLLLMLGLTLRDLRPDSEVRVVEGYTPWEEATLELAAGVPVQDGGRVKPLVSFASFKMLQLHGSRSLKVEGEGGATVKVEPLAWLMDCLFRPDFADQMPTFRVDNSKVVEAVGLEARGKRDHYSYAELRPALGQLMELAASYEAMVQNDRTLEPDQQQALDLARNVQVYEGLSGYLDFARGGVVLPRKEGIDLDRAKVSAVMATAPLLRESLSRSYQAGETPRPELEAMVAGLNQAVQTSKFFLYLFPPADGAGVEWISAGDRIWNVMAKTTREPEQSIDDIKMLEELATALPEGEEAFRGELGEFRESVTTRAGARGEAEKVPLEVSYYERDWFLLALVVFLAAIPLVVAMWLAGGSRFSRITAGIVWLMNVAGLVMLVIPITKRSLIMERPPVGNLYDTIIFIAMAFVALALVIELMIRRRVAIGVAPMVAAFLIVLARLFEVGDAKDHMDPLVAVLVSNFWLTIHVITIVLGYAAGLVTAVLAIAAVLLRSLRLDDKSLRRSLLRAIYGCVCLTLFLSLVGTVLGGIWANYSWGRFWGWDPKENGALMIVLWNLAILHARAGGYIRDWGLYLASIFGAVVIAFSWWHVNFLGVGLHNYGFAADKIGALMAFYAAMGGFLLWGGVAAWRERAARS